MKWLKERLLERAFNASINEREGEPGVIGQIPITINVSIEKSRHAAERQFRHVQGDEKGGSQITGQVLSDEDIMRVANKAVNRIISMILNNQIDVGQEFVVKKKQINAPTINLVCDLERVDNRNFNMKVITVMMKDNFFAKPGTKEIVL
jgi:hypothetical protein